MTASEVLLLVLQFLFAVTLRHEKPVTQLEWSGKCTTNTHALNDCNWCYCNKNHKYICEARVCEEVNMFGHFNDAIKDINVGMEGHGVWRRTVTACEAGVHYRRGELLCICTDEGNWPSPVCRDVFRILHSVEITKEKKPNFQECSPYKLYLIGCNVCFCSSKGVIDPEMCTKKSCSEHDPILSYNEKLDEKVDENIEDNAVYAECTEDHKYKLGCKTCVCLRNNRLYCDNCTRTRTIRHSYCENMKPGQVFSRDCNLCYCDPEGYSYCTTKKCIHDSNLRRSFSRDAFKEVALPITEVWDAPYMTADSCIPGQRYRKECNTCWCMLKHGIKLMTCTTMGCSRRGNNEVDMHTDCVENTVYELDCLICRCEVEDGVKSQTCQVNPLCVRKGSKRIRNLDSLHGYCEPLHIYKEDCNECRCLSDGKTVMCTSKICDKKLEPIKVDVIPVIQSGGVCPKGLSYKVGCNLCFCLSNGNAICTTADCNKLE